MEAYAVQMPSVVFTNCKSRDLPVSVKDRKSSPAITCRPVGEGEDNTLPVISYNEDAQNKQFFIYFKFLFLTTYY